MKVKYNKEVDVMIIRFSDEAVVESDESRPGIIFDYDQNGRVVKVEILDASQHTLSPSKFEYEVV